MPSAVLVASGNEPMRARFQLHEPRRVKCRECNEEFLTYSAVQIFCTKKCMWSWHNRKRKSYHKNWSKTHREGRRETCRKARRKVQNLWQGKKKIVYVNHTDPIVAQSELFVANEILPKHGFTEILSTRTFSHFFPCDILAKKDGKICMIEVTLSYERKINKRLLPLERFLAARVFVCHVRPDFGRYYLIEVTGRTFSSCEGIFMEEIRRGFK